MRSVRRRAGGENAIFWGVVSSLLFSVTYVVNNAMSRSGGDWLWGASLRFLFMLPPLLILTAARKELQAVFREIRRAPMGWLLWSTVGFGIFYAPITFASAYGPSWLVAGTFQFTILAGALLTPIFRLPDDTRGHIPVGLFPAFLIIILGVFLIQLDHVQAVQNAGTLLYALPVLLSATAYPLGNRKMMALCENRLNTVQRVLGMTLCSLPLWIALAIGGYLRSGWPSGMQTVQSLVVALFSGLFATILFFHATQMVQTQPKLLAMVESTQCGEVVFSLFGGVLLLHDPLPDAVGWIGLLLIVGGMIFNSLFSIKSDAVR